MDNYNKTQVYPYDPRKLAIRSFLRPEDDLISNCGQILEKTVSFDNILHFIDDQNNVFHKDLDGGITFSSETPKRSDRSTENGITFPDPVKKPSAFPATINITVLLMNSTPPTSF